MQAVKASKQRHAQDQTKARLVKKARIQYEKNGSQFFSADEMADQFIEQEEVNSSLFNAVAKLNKDISRIETEKYELSATLEKLEFK